MDKLKLEKVHDFVNIESFAEPDYDIYDENLAREQLQAFLDAGVDEGGDE